MSCFIIGENLIWRLFVIRQITKLKSSPNFPAIQYVKYLGVGTIVNSIHKHKLYSAANTIKSHVNTLPGGRKHYQGYNTELFACKIKLN